MAKPKAKAKSGDQQSPTLQLEKLVEEMLQVAKMAKRNRVNLSGYNHYGNKTATLRTDAANAFNELVSSSVGDTSAMAELIDTVFAPATQAKNRLEAARNLLYSLRTTWRSRNPANPSQVATDFFPMSIFAEAKRGYLTSLGRQMNGTYERGWYDACAVMMRRLIEIAIIEVYEFHNLGNKIKDTNGNYVQLTELIAKLQSETKLNLSRNTKKSLPKLKDVGHHSAHGRYYFAQKNDMDAVRDDCRITLEELMRHAQLIN